MTPGTHNRMAAALLLTLAFAPQHAHAQTARRPAPQQNLTVIVVNAHARPVQPVPSAKVALSYTASGARVTESTKVTNPNGEAFLQVSVDAAQRDDLRVEISGVTNLVIYEPADGQLTGLPTHVTLNLLPKGSPALLGSRQIEAMLNRLASRVNSLERQNREMQAQLATTQSRPGDLSAAFAELARNYGFTKEDFDREVQRWAQHVQEDASATPRRKALAEIALKHYDSADRLFGQALSADTDGLDTDTQKFLDERRTKLRQLVEDANQRAGVEQLELHYHQATLTLQSARDRVRVDAESKLFANDAGLHQILLDVSLRVANAEVTEATDASAVGSLPLLEQVQQEYTTLAAQYLAMNDRQNWAIAEYDLGRSYDDAAEALPAAESQARLRQARQALNAALTVQTRDDQPMMWARITQTLAHMLIVEGQNQDNAQAEETFKQSVAAYQQAADVFSGQGAMQDWGRALTGKGFALVRESEKAGVAASALLRAQAIETFEQSLKVNTRDDDALDWALTQTDLGIALAEQAIMLPGADAAPLFDKAVQAFNDAMTVSTLQDHPQDWAMDQNNIASTLGYEAIAASGDRAVQLFEQSAQAYRNALKVRTVQDLPRYAARSERNLAYMLTQEAQIVSSADTAAKLLAEAEQALLICQQVFTRDAAPLDWADAEAELARVHAAQHRDRQAGEEFDASIAVDPSIAAVLLDAALLEHDRLFNYPRALELATLHSHATGVPSQLLAEASLTADRFPACVSAAAQLAPSSGSGAAGVPAQIVELACAWAAHDYATALAADRALLAAAPSFKDSPGTFSGTLHYIATSPTFATGRTAWIVLFTAAQNGDGPTLTAALHQLEPLLQP